MKLRGPLYGLHLAATWRLRLNHVCGGDAIDVIDGWNEQTDTIRYDTIRDAVLTCARKPT